MSVIFQLYCAKDLKNLGAQLEEFKKEVGRIMNTTPAVLEHIKIRAFTVFEQLVSQPASRQPIPPDPTQDVLSQLFTPAEIDQLTEEQKDIIKMAITCHLAHSPDAVETIRTETDQVFRRLTNEVLEGEDVFYTH